MHQTTKNYTTQHIIINAIIETNVATQQVATRNNNFYWETHCFLVQITNRKVFGIQMFGKTRTKKNHRYYQLFAYTGPRSKIIQHQTSIQYTPNKYMIRSAIIINIMETSSPS